MFENYQLQTETACSELNFNQSTPHSYNGTVLSGYLKVNKGNSVLAFIFYGK